MSNSSDEKFFSFVFMSFFFTNINEKFCYINVSFTPASKFESSTMNDLAPLGIHKLSHGTRLYQGNF